MNFGDAGPSNEAELELRLMCGSEGAGEDSSEESGEKLHLRYANAVSGGGMQSLPAQFDGTGRKGKARLVKCAPDTRENCQRKPKRHQNLSVPSSNESSEVILLQSILGSSRFEQIASKFRFPISGHWAIQIREHVFELNRMESWIKTTTLPVLSAGARSQIDWQTRQEYEAERGVWSITSSYLGNVTMSQDEIFKTVQKRNEFPPSYAFFSNNCQHFIIEFCEELKIDCSLQDLQRLWFKSRFIFVAGSLCYGCMSILNPITLLALQQFKLSAPSEDEPLFRTYLLEFCYNFGMFAIIAAVGAAFTLCYNGPPRTISGGRFVHGALYTGPHIRERLLQTPYGVSRLLIIFLLWIEKYPYFLHLTSGTSGTLVIIIHHICFPPDSCSQHLVVRLAIGILEAILPIGCIMVLVHAYLKQKNHIIQGTPTIREVYRDEATYGYVALQRERRAYERLQRDGGNTRILRFLRRCPGGHTTEYPDNGVLTNALRPVSDDRRWKRATKVFGLLYSLLKSLKLLSIIPDGQGIRLRYALQAAQGLAYIHSKYVTHGEVHCDNFFCNRDWDVQLGNFTSSQVHDEDSEVATTFQQSVQSDMADFGAVLHEIMSSRDLHEVSVEQYRDDAEDLDHQPRIVNQTTCMPLDDVIRRCLNREYTAMSEAVEDIKAIVEQIGPLEHRTISILLPIGMASHTIMSYIYMRLWFNLSYSYFTCSDFALLPKDPVGEVVLGAASMGLVLVHCAIFLHSTGLFFRSH